MRLIWPDVGEDIPRRLVVVAFGAIVLIAVASFVLGATNSLFLHCADFEIAGMSLPPGCAP